MIAQFIRFPSICLRIIRFQTFRQQKCVPFFHLIRRNQYVFVYRRTQHRLGIKASHSDPFQDDRIESSCLCMKD